jgi:hypothetical protein
MDLLPRMDAGGARTPLVKFYDDRSAAFIPERTGGRPINSRCRRGATHTAAVPLPAAQAYGEDGPSRVRLALMACPTDTQTRRGCWLTESGRSGAFPSTANSEEDRITHPCPERASPAEAQELIDPLAKSASDRLLFACGVDRLCPAAE